MTFDPNHPAYQAGVKAAQALKPGDVFEGASPTANAQGFTGGEDHQTFINGYLIALADLYPRGVVTDGDNRICDEEDA